MNVVESDETGVDIVEANRWVRRGYAREEEGCGVEEENDVMI